MNFNKLIPELSVFDISQTKDFYKKLGFKIEYERAEENFVFMSFEDSQFMFEQIHDKGWNTGALEYPLGRGINLSIAVENVEALYETVKKRTNGHLPRTYKKHLSGQWHRGRTNRIPHPRPQWIPAQIYKLTNLGLRLPHP